MKRFVFLLLCLLVVGCGQKDVVLSDEPDFNISSVNNGVLFYSPESDDLHIWHEDKIDTLPIHARYSLIAPSPHDHDLIVLERTEDVSNVFLLSSDNLEKKQLLFSTRNRISYASFSPLGHALVFVEFDASDTLKPRSFHISLYSFENNSFVTIAEASLDPVWSADGKSLLYRHITASDFSLSEIMLAHISSEGQLEDSSLIAPGLAAVFGRQDIIYVQEKDSALQLMRYDPFTDATSVVVSTNTAVGDYTGHYLQISPDQHSVLWTSSTAKDPRAVQALLVNLEKGTAEKILSEAVSAVWFDDSTILFEPVPALGQNSSLQSLNLDTQKPKDIISSFSPNNFTVLSHYSSYPFFFHSL